MILVNFNTTKVLLIELFYIEDYLPSVILTQYIYSVYYTDKEIVQLGLAIANQSQVQVHAWEIKYWESL